MKRIAWTLLVGVTTSLATAWTYKATSRLWRRIFKEPPPDTLGWARMLMATPLRKKVMSRHRVPWSVV